MKKILVATDYSREARHALHFALGLAGRAQADIILFHAFNQPLSVATAYRLDEVIAQLEKEKNHTLQEYAQEVKTERNRDFALHFLAAPAKAGKGKGDLTKSRLHYLEPGPEAEIAEVKVICVSKFGLATEAIPVAIEVYAADLVIMGMRGAGPVSQAFLGSTVTGVIQRAKAPVLALPLKATLKASPNFVFAIDLSAMPDPEMLDRLRVLVNLFRADLQVLHLYRDNDPQQEQEKAITTLEILDKAFYDLSYQVHFQQREDFVAGIQDFLATQAADLLALVPKHHTFLEILLQDTFTGLMTDKAVVPILTLPFEPIGEWFSSPKSKKIKSHSA